jgi:hypothetical protein
LVAKVAQSDFFRAELLLSFDFSGLTLLFIAFDGFEPRLEFGKPEPIMMSDSSATSEEIVSVFVDVSAESVATLQVNGHLDI